MFRKMRCYIIIMAALVLLSMNVLSETLPLDPEILKTLTQDKNNIDSDENDTVEPHETPPLPEEILKEIEKKEETKPLDKDVLQDYIKNSENTTIEQDKTENKDSTEKKEEKTPDEPVQTKNQSSGNFFIKPDEEPKENNRKFYIYGFAIICVLIIIIVLYRKFRKKNEVQY